LRKQAGSAIMSGMSSWRDPERWARWVRGDDCPICDRVATADAVAGLEVCRIMMSEDAPMRGYAWLPFTRHVVELHELTEEEGAAFMRDIRRASRAIAKVTDAVKLNYEIHGNTVPHLHLHIFPRYRGDRFEGGPIDPRVVREPVYAPGEFDELRARIARALEAR
jgi:diadenosine tetraphosphate (Ap4A) HIT family hydrolase